MLTPEIGQNPDYVHGKDFLKSCNKGINKYLSFVHYQHITLCVLIKATRTHPFPNTSWIFISMETYLVTVSSSAKVSDYQRLHTPLQHLV